MQELQLCARGLWEELSSEAGPQLQPEQQAHTLFSSRPSESETWGTDKFTSHTSLWNDHTFHTSYFQQQTVSVLVLTLPSRSISTSSFTWNQDCSQLLKPLLDFFPPTIWTVIVTWLSLILLDFKCYGRNCSWLWKN